MATASNVVVGKPKIGGAISVADTTVSLPIDASTALSTTDFKNLGYVSNDGVTNAKSATTTDITAWGGDTVNSGVGAQKDTYKFKLIESLNIDVLKEVYGASNVVGTSLSAGITVKSNAAERTPRAWVIDMVEGAALHRIVIPHGTITERGDVVYKDDVAVGFEITILCAPDASGNSHYDYYKTV